MCVIKLFTGSYLSDFDVKVAHDDIDPDQASNIHVCAYVPGAVPQGGWMEIYCDSPTNGRWSYFVQLECYFLFTLVFFAADVI